jgi:hypothetical protein
MKKIQILFLSFITLLLVSCGEQSTTSGITGTMASEITNSSETTTLNNESINPFEGLNFISHLQLDPSVIDQINSSSGRIAYIDEDLYVYYEEGLSPSSFFVNNDGDIIEYDTQQAMGYSDDFIINFDVENNVIYYYDSPYIDSVPSTVNSSIDLYASRYRELKYYNSKYSLVANSFITFKGETLFSADGTVAFPYINIGDDLRFYSYESNITQDQGCSIKSYDGFNDTPEINLVHDEYTCSAEYQIKNRNVVIELMDHARLGGYVSITPDGEIHVMDFTVDIPGFRSCVYDSFRVINEWIIYFQYEDADGESHSAVTSYDLSYICIDEMSLSMAIKNVYVDQNYRFYKYSSTEYRLYKDEERFYTYTTRSSSFTFVFFFRFGDHGVVFETSTATGDGRITNINLADGSVVSYDKPMISVSFQVGNFILLIENSDCYLYDIINDNFITTGLSGAIKEVNSNYCLIYSDENVYLYDLMTNDYIQMNRIGHLRRTYQPYAFLVEYQGEYYLIG